MPHKQRLFRSEARAKILRGSTALADAVRITLGPRSKSVWIGKKWGPPVDPTEVVRLALEHAVSVAGVLPLSDATMTDLPEPEKHAHSGDIEA